jgi:alpha-beta hydrolase superfamily lysophospholipase
MYFGADRELFGVYHPPASAATNSVLLCPPLGQDQIRSHRLYRQLANALVAEGIAVLRFDYYGSGDSAGDSMQVDCDRCIDDIVVAANQLRTLSAVDRIVAFGARLGGSLALAAADAARFAELVVWDPVLDGAAHVARLDAQQNALRLDAKRFTKPRSAADVAGQWLGFEFSAPLRRQLTELQVEPPAALQTHWLDSLPSASKHDQKRFAAAGVTITALQPPTPWDDPDRLELAILSHELVQWVSSHLREAR